MNQFSFEYPYVFLLAGIFWICERYCPAKTVALYFPHIKNLIAVHLHRNRLLTILKWTGIASLLTALASPVVSNEYRDIKRQGRDIMLIIDSSDSMRQRGFDAKNPYKTKFDVVKEVVNDFIEHRNNQWNDQAPIADQPHPWLLNWVG
jgi:Ca-activated chloride channel family protein